MQDLPSHCLIPGWSDLPLLAQLVRHHRPGVVSARSVLGVLAAFGAILMVAYGVLMRASTDCSHYTFRDIVASCEARADNNLLVSLIVGAVGLLSAGVLFAWWFIERRNPPEFVRVLRDRPREVCWVYVESTRTGTSFLVLGLANRTKVRIWAPYVPSQVLAKCVAPILPWATFGYGGPQQDQFQRNPRALYRG